jgi:hypothetical protein
VKRRLSLGIFASVALMAAAVPAGTAPADPADAGCAKANQPFMAEVSEDSAVARFEIRDDCFLPAHAWIEYRRKGEGLWDRVASQLTKAGSQTRDVRFGGLQRKEVYEVRSGITYFGVNRSTPTVFCTCFKPAEDMHLDIYSRASSFQANFKWLSSPVGFNAPELQWGINDFDQRDVLGREHRSCKPAENGRERCNVIGAGFKVGGRDADFIPGRDYQVRLRLLNNTYADAFGAQFTGTVRFTAGKPGTFGVGEAP